jgi:hypothetical protein
MTVKIDAMVGEIPQTFEYGNLFAREDVGGHARLRVGFNEAQDACVLTLECVPLRLDLAGPNFERSLPDATHGNCHLLLALGSTIERLTAFAEVIERCGDRIVFGYRPVDSVCLQPVVLPINGAIATQHGIEA